jgi:riboflavin kinase/FMN adenylyltransferase
VRVVEGIDALPPGLRFVLAIGVFDGVHRGHARIVRALTDAAAKFDAEPVVLTFDPHPSDVLRGTAPAQLCDLAERLGRLERLGVRTVAVQRFDDSFAHQSPEEFLARAAKGRHLAGLVVTSDSAFGRDRAGGVPAVRQLSEQFGYEVIEVPQLASDGATISSSRLRALLADGRLSEVNRLLGRPYAVVGEVVHGDRRGRELGYPTANLRFDRAVALPADGIYAVRVTWGGTDPLAPERMADGVASLGVRPTFHDGGARILEVHLFDFDEDLYGVRLRVEFVRRLRGEKRFASADALVRQMDRDSARARVILERAEGESRAVKPNGC